MSLQDFFNFFSINIKKQFGIISFLFFWLLLWLIIGIFWLQLLGSIALTHPLWVQNYSKQRIEVIKLLPFSIEILNFLIWVFTFVLFKQIVDELIEDKKKTNSTYRLTQESWEKEWIFNGGTKFIGDSLMIMSSRAGCLLEKYTWENFEAYFEFQFFDNGDPILGIIFRAQDLDNYLMLEVRVRKANKIFTVKPHIRYQGMWETINEESINSTFMNEGWHEVSLTVKGNYANLFIKDVGSFMWLLPTHVDINHIEEGTKSVSLKNVPPEKTPNFSFGKKISSLPELSFRNAHGMFGFRAHFQQGAQIRNLRINKII